ncbi:MAG: hypothetical protein ACTSQJ_00765 [Promethearchaeota archaeon]
MSKLDQESQKILETARLIAGDNNTFRIQSLYEKIKNESNISSKSFLSSVENLIEQKIIVESSKLSKFDVLLNQKRADIFKNIRNYPGTHFSIILKKISSKYKDISLSEFIWHLEILLKFQYIKRVEVKNYTIFVPSDIDDIQGKFYFILREQTNQKIVDFLIKDEPVLLEQFSLRLLLPKEDINAHLKVLNEFNIIKVKKSEFSEDMEIILNPYYKDLFIEIISKIKNP